MGSVAVALCERGFKVTGSDENIFPPMSIFLGKKGIALKEGYRAENIPADADVVVPIRRVVLRPSVSTKPGDLLDGRKQQCQHKNYADGFHPREGYALDLPTGTL